MASALSAPITRIQVRVVVGAVELAAGSLLELRIYEAGKAVRHLPLTHGEAWPRDATLVIPVTLSEPLDPRTVLRFGFAVAVLVGVYGGLIVHILRTAALI